MGFANSDEWRRAEVMSANTLGSARGLSKLGAYMANGGSAWGKTIMSERAHDDFHANPYELYDYAIFNPTIFTDGGVADTGDGFFGWAGFGGSIFQWNHDLEISFSYVPADMLPLGVNERGTYLREIVTDCVREMWGDDSDWDDDRRGGKGDKDKGGDDFIDWSEDKDRIIMTGSDGSKLYIEMGATSIFILFTLCCCSYCHDPLLRSMT